MKKFLWVVFIFFVMVVNGPLVNAAVDSPSHAFYVYADSGSPRNHYIPSGLMGDYTKVYIDQNYTESPYAGTSCMKITYYGDGLHRQRWAGVYWQNPANNWGSIDGGYDLTGAKKLVFWARGEKGGEVIGIFKFGGIKGNFADSDMGEQGPIVLTDQWQQYVFDLTERDLSYISGGFCWVTDLDKNPGGLTFYLDEIRYEME